MYINTMRLLPPQAISLTGKEFIHFPAIGDGFNCWFSKTWEKERFLRCLPDSHYQLPIVRLGLCGWSDDTEGGNRDAWGSLATLAPEIRVQVTRRSLFDPGFPYKGFHSSSRRAQSSSLGTHIFRGSCRHSCAPRFPLAFAVWLWERSCQVCTAACWKHLATF